ncbi:MAG: hypothetical protein CVV33_00205 [Methanomicrobiales archaeon HGW-Methanomicrobiales-4]|nr:MAG: hypothetical protein CVV33_00205 [Methanomicrobiales archaeon HGW-Methanomicrobiales-4]
MIEERDYLTGCITILLAILILFCIVPMVSANDDYLDEGYLGMPAWLYARLDTTVMNNIIGIVHGHTFFSPSENIPADVGYSFVRNTDFPSRMKKGVFW